MGGIAHQKARFISIKAIILESRVVYTNVMLHRDLIIGDHPIISMLFFEAPRLTLERPKVDPIR